MLEKENSPKIERPHPRRYEDYSPEEIRNFEATIKIYEDITKIPKEKWGADVLAFEKAREDAIYDDSTDFNPNNGAQPHYTRQ